MLPGSFYHTLPARQDGWDQPQFCDLCSWKTAKGAKS